MTGEHLFAIAIISLVTVCYQFWSIKSSLSSLEKRLEQLLEFAEETKNDRLEVNLNGRLSNLQRMKFSPGITRVK